MLMHNGNGRCSYEAPRHTIISRAIVLELSSMLRLHFQSLKPSHVQTWRQSALLNVQITLPPTEIYNRETADSIIMRSRKRTHLLCFSVSGIFLLLLAQCGLSSGKKNVNYKFRLLWYHFLYLGYVWQNHLKGPQRSTQVKMWICVRKERTSPTSSVWSVLLVISKFYADDEASFVLY